MTIRINLFALMLGIGLFSLICNKAKSQTTGTSILMTLQGAIQTAPNIFEYDLMIKNTGTTTMALRSYSCGVNHTTGLENGGTISYSYIAGSRDGVFSTLPIPTTSHTAPNHLRLSMTTATAGNEVPLTAGFNYKIARVRVQTTATSFPCDFNPFLPASPLNILQVTTVAGKTECAATCYIPYPSANSYTLFGTANTPTAAGLPVLTGIVTPSPTGPAPFKLNCSVMLNLNCFIQSYYVNSTNSMRPVLANQGMTSTATACDNIVVELHNSSSPYNTLYTTNAVLNQDGSAQCQFSWPVLTGNYYIAVKHRNAIQTWSASPVIIGSSSISYNFINASSKAYGANQIQVSPGVWTLYSGDINHDEEIDLIDLSEVENGVMSFNSGYFATDINGDGNVDIMDIPGVKVNIDGFIFSAHP